VKTRTHLVILSLEYLCIPATPLLVKECTYAFPPYTSSTIKDIFVLPVAIFATYGIIIVGYAFAIQSAFLAKKLLTKKFPVLHKPILFIPIFIVVLFISWIFFGVSFNLIGWL
jgi:hypothetical protein